MFELARLKKRTYYDMLANLETVVKFYCATHFTYHASHKQTTGTHSLLNYRLFYKYYPEILSTELFL